MIAVVSLLDAEHAERVRSLWDEWAQLTGVRRMAERAPFPHITYLGGQTHDLPRLATLLLQVAGRMYPFTLRTAGVGLFGGAEPVVYLSVACTQELLALHAQLWQQSAALTSQRIPLYQPGAWVPHITLAQGDVSPANLPQLVSLMAERPLAWELVISNLALAVREGDRWVVDRVLDFEASTV